MSDVTALPVARVWQMSGGDLDDPSFIASYTDDVVPRLLAIPGHLGLCVLLDRDQDLLRGISFWDSAESRDRSLPDVGRIVDAVLRLTSTSFQGSWNYDVAMSSFRGVLGHAARPGALERLTVRIGLIEGGNVAEPAMVEVLKKHTAAAVAPVEDCVGTLLLVAPERSTVLGASFWADPEAAERTHDLSAATTELVVASTGSRPATLRTYEVLAHVPMARSV